MGAIREDYGLESFTYGEVLAAGTFRRGITDTFTAELHGETQIDGASALGLDTAWQVGTLGIVTATAAAGRGPRRFRLAGWLGVEHSGRRFDLFARTQLASERFVQSDAQPFEPRPKQRSFAGVGIDLRAPGQRPGCAYGRQSYWDAAGVEHAGCQLLGMRKAATASPALFANHTRSQDSQTDVYLGWTMPMGNRRNVGSSLSYRPDLPIGDPVEATATLQQNLPAGSGTGYYVSASSTADAQASLSYQGRAGQVGIEYSRRGDTDGWRATALGGLTLTSAGVLPTRWLDQSFAVVQVADYPGLTVYVENQPIGRTDRKGRVLLVSSPALRYEPGEPGSGRAAAGCVTFEPGRAPHARVPQRRGRAIPDHARDRKRRCVSCRTAASPCRPAREFMHPVRKPPLLSMD
jgi:outer membrane usher protein